MIMHDRSAPYPDEDKEFVEVHGFPPDWRDSEAPTPDKVEAESSTMIDLCSLPDDTTIDFQYW